MVNCFVVLEDFVNDVQQALCDKLLPEGVGVSEERSNVKSDLFY